MQIPGHGRDSSKVGPWPYKAKPHKLQAMKRYRGFEKALSYPNPHEWTEDASLEIPPWCLADIGTRDNNNSRQGERSTKYHSRIPEIAGIMTSFDNTPRRNYEEARLWSATEPNQVVEKFKKSLHSALYYEACCFFNDPKENDRRLKKKEDDDRLIVINAMNEWAEGMSLEPSDVYGRRFLDSIRDAKQEVLKNGCKL